MKYGMPLLPPPSVFGLPKKFTSWRPDQQEAFQLILDSTTRFVGLTMPTGSGKSLVYLAAMVLSGARSVCLTASKGLQDQLGEDFGETGLYDMRGQKNYPCLALGPDGEFAGMSSPEEATCEHGPCHVGGKCSLREVGCTYYDRARVAVGKRMVLTNYAYHLAQRRYSTGMGAIDLLVLDEAHQAMDELSGALTIKLEKWMLAAVGVESSPPVGSPMQAWRDWGSYHAGKLKKRIESLASPQSGSEAKYRRRLRSVARVLESLSEMELGNWVEDHTPESWVWEVVNPAAYAEELLYQGAKKVVFLSATLTDKTLALLGVTGDVTRWEAPSRFPVERRPVIYIPTTQVDTRMKPEQVNMWISRIDQLVDQRRTINGIVHSRSYKRRDEILALCRNSDVMITHDANPKKKTPGEMQKTVMQFKKGTHPPQWLVSPAVVTGWDFPYDQCRAQIMAKLPFPDTRSAVMKTRTEMDPDYFAYLTAQDLEQAIGRGMRASDDWCESFIIDDHWKWFVAKHRKLFTKGFLAACRQSLTIPKPLLL